MKYKLIIIMVLLTQSLIFSQQNEAFKSIIDRNFEKISALLDDGLDANLINSKNESLLYLSIREKFSLDIVKNIVNHGARVNSITPDGFRLLTYSIRKGDPEVTKYLFYAAIKQNYFDYDFKDFKYYSKYKDYMSAYFNYFVDDIIQNNISNNEDIKKLFVLNRYLFVTNEELIKKLLKIDFNFDEEIQIDEDLIKPIDYIIERKIPQTLKLILSEKYKYKFDSMLNILTNEYYNSEDPHGFINYTDTKEIIEMISNTIYTKLELESGNLETYSYNNETFKIPHTLLEFLNKNILDLFQFYYFNNDIQNIEKIIKNIDKKDLNKYINKYISDLIDKNNTKLMSIFLNYGYDLNSPVYWFEGGDSSSNYYPWKYALKNNLTMVKYFINNGANINSIEEFSYPGKMLMYTTLETKNRNNKYTTYISDEIYEYLIEKGAKQFDTFDLGDFEKINYGFLMELSDIEVKIYNYKSTDDKEVDVLKNQSIYIIYSDYSDLNNSKYFIKYKDNENFKYGWIYINDLKQYPYPFPYPKQQFYQKIDWK